MKQRKEPKNQAAETENLTPNEMLCGIEPMIWSILSKYKMVPYETQKDIKQEAMIYLACKVIPKFNPALAKFSSFAYRCVTNFINRRLQRDVRRGTRDLAAAERYHGKIAERTDLGPLTLEGECSEILVNITSGADMAIMKGKELMAIMLIMENPYITQRNIARKLGYKRPSAVSMMLLRMRKRLKNGKYRQA